jgi:hypothetical protein
LPQAGHTWHMIYASCAHHVISSTQATTISGLQIRMLWQDNAMHCGLTTGGQACMAPRTCAKAGRQAGRQAASVACAGIETKELSPTWPQTLQQASQPHQGPAPPAGQTCQDVHTGVTVTQTLT